MKLNIGSSVAKGEYRSNEWVNLDLKNHKGVTVLGSGFALPFKDNSFDVIHSVHVLEHLTRDKIPIMIKEMARVIKPEGEVFIEVPNFKQIVELLYKAYQYGDLNGVHQWRTSVYGKTERAGMAHHFGFDRLTLANYLTNSGFKTITDIDKEEEMISGHYLQEPVILVKAKKL